MPFSHAGCVPYLQFPEHLSRFSDSIPPGHRIASNHRLSDSFGCKIIVREGGLVEDGDKSDGSLDS
jgi:hypothetical protein